MKIYKGDFKCKKSEYLTTGSEGWMLDLKKLMDTTESSQCIGTVGETGCNKLNNLN